MADEAGDKGRGKSRGKNKGEGKGKGKAIRSIHDAFCKLTLQHRQYGDRFLREHLPKKYAELLGPDLPEVMPGSYVDNDLREVHTDLLLKVRLKDGSEIWPYFLIEHKSQPDPLARMQLARYVFRILERWYWTRREAPTGRTWSPWIMS